MKARLILLILFMLNMLNSRAQRQNKIGYIDMNYILERIPEYNEANAQLDAKIKQWKTEIDIRQDSLRSLKQDLENERPLLTPELIKEREEEIRFEERKLQEYQEQRFGTHGDMMKQSQQIARPIEDQVFNIIQEIGLDREYDFIFDSSSDALMLFSAERHDISDQVLASINRNANRLKREKEFEARQLDRPEGEKEYKPVQKARIDKEEREARETEKRRVEQEREEHFEEIRNERESTRTQRVEEQKSNREQMLEERQRARDSINKAREKMYKDRQIKRDSILNARKNR